MEKEIKELSLLLLYLTSWEEDKITETRRSWKGYPFDVLDELEDEDLIFGNKKAKSIYFTSEGIEKAEQLMKKYIQKEES